MLISITVAMVLLNPDDHVDIHLVRNGGDECVGPVTLSQVKIPAVNQMEPSQDNS